MAIVIPGMPVLTASFDDPAGRVNLAFSWPSAVGGVVAHYEATLWADAARSTPVTGGVTQSFTVPAATFAGVPRGAGYLLDVVAVGSDASRSAPASLLATSPYAATPAVGVTPAGVTLPDPADDDAPGVLVPPRPFYGSVAGVKRWAGILTYGNQRGQVSDADVLYFLMLASDDADAMLADKYIVPLTKYLDNSGFYRYPPGIDGAIDRKAAGMLLYSRKAILTEQQSGTANGLMGYSDKLIGQLAAKNYLIGQTMSAGVLPQVYNPAPRNFTMAGDPEGHIWSPGIGYPDVRYLRQHGLPYVAMTWRYGYGGTWSW